MTSDIGLSHARSLIRRMPDPDRGSRFINPDNIQESIAVIVAEVTNNALRRNSFGGGSDTLDTGHQSPIGLSTCPVVLHEVIARITVKVTRSDQLPARRLLRAFRRYSRRTGKHPCPLPRSIEPASLAHRHARSTATALTRHY